MLGYLQMQKSELLVKEAEIYKAVYCSLCRTIGKDYSFLCRMLLSYDFTFYALLSMALESGDCPGFKRGRCCCNPLKSCNYCRGEEKSLRSAAALTVIAAYYKLCDDIQDSGFLKSVFSRFLRLFVSRQRKKALKIYPRFDELVLDMMNRQRAAENADEICIDVCCEPTAIMLSEVFALLSDVESEKRILRETGYHIGRWIYLADAADDLENDAKTGSFNCLAPLLIQCGDREKFADECNSLMNMAIAGSFRAYELLNIKKFGGILRNHFIYGMPSIQKKILYNNSDKKDLIKNIDTKGS